MGLWVRWKSAGRHGTEKLENTNTQGTCGGNTSQIRHPGVGVPSDNYTSLEAIAPIKGLGSMKLVISVMQSVRAIRVNIFISGK